MRTRRRLCEPKCRRRGLTGVYPCAVGQGVHGGQSPLSRKIEMFILAKLNVAKKQTSIK
jgi:hypothetical protein